MTTPSPEAIEAAESAYWAALKAAGEGRTKTPIITAALTAAVPFIAAQARAEALEEIAEWEAEADASIRCAANLRQSTKRADRQEADKYEHHATIARNLAVRMRGTLAATIEGKR